MASDEADIIFGAAINPDMSDAMKVTVVATGFDRAEESPLDVLAKASERGEKSAPNAAPRASVQPKEPARESFTRETAPQTVASRPQNPSLRPGASAGELQIRESISFPKRTDADWDVPAYQRRNTG
jgi:cell division protein FtsZ